jgi:uncharacterized membrane protein YhaH (DUF805 family)
MFGITMAVMVLLLAGGGFALLQGNWGLALLMVAAIAPLGIYWRVIMMRRCRDIGWPAATPWLISGVQVALSFSLPSSHGAVGAAAGSAFLLVSLVAFADFVFTIVIGCIRTKQAVDYAAVFGDGPGTFQRAEPRDGEALRGGPDRFDEAIARALEARQRGEGARGAPQPAHPAPALAARRSAGFGRRVV